jgi:hypothetical protein
MRLEKLPKHPTLLRRMRDARVKQLVPRCPPLAASIGTQRGGGCQVTLRHRGRTRTVYVPKGLKDEVEAWVQEHRRLKRLSKEITDLQLELIRLHRTEGARRARVEKARGLGGEGEARRGGKA